MIFSHYQTRPLMDKDLPPVMPLSTDLGLSSVEVYQTPKGWKLPNQQVLTYAQIQTINQDENGCFLFKNGEIRKVEAFSEYTNRYYSLMPTAKSPTLLISGIPMHRIKGTTPDEDTSQKIKALGKSYGVILDTATGLGYTAIKAAQTADKVITIEFDPLVLEICKINPWSQAMFTNPKIHKIIGDSADLVMTFPDHTFNGIIHDPPTFNLAGHLYSQTLYDIFYRILKPNGRVFHYIGSPDSKYGATIGRGVVNRLQKSGFDVTPKGKAFGVLAKK